MAASRIAFVGLSLVMAAGAVVLGAASATPQSRKDASPSKQDAPPSTRPNFDLDPQSPVIEGGRMNAVMQRRLDVNDARPADLEALQDIDAETARKIAAGRPYGCVEDLRRAGVSAQTIEHIRPMVEIRREFSLTAESRPAAPRRGSTVWVNPDTRLFHRDGDGCYGKTARGRYMPESQALAEGYRALKE